MNWYHYVIFCVVCGLSWYSGYQKGWHAGFDAHTDATTAAGEH